MEFWFTNLHKNADFCPRWRLNMQRETWNMQTASAEQQEHETKRTFHTAEQRRLWLCGLQCALTKNQVLFVAYNKRWLWNNQGRDRRSQKRNIFHFVEVTELATPHVFLLLWGPVCSVTLQRLRFNIELEFRVQFKNRLMFGELIMSKIDLTASLE